MEARSASLPRIGGALAPRSWAYAAALLAAFVLAYAIATSGSDPGPPAGASSALPDHTTPAVPQHSGLRDVAPLPRLAPAELIEPPAEVPG
jgi:hypothetical protein